MLLHALFLLLLLTRTQIMTQLAQRGKLLPLLEAGTERARVERGKALARRRAEAAGAAASGTT